MGELKVFFSLRARHELTTTSDGLEQELTTAYETILNWVSFAQTIKEWNSPIVITLVEPVILRLCALRRASPYALNDKRRAEAINAVYKAAALSSSTKDRLAELMMEPLARV